MFAMCVLSIAMTVIELYQLSWKPCLRNDLISFYSLILLKHELGKLNQMLERFLKKRMELIGCVEGEKMTSTESSSKFLSSFEDEEGEEVHPFI